MRMSKLVGRKIKEDPKDAVTTSHKFLIRGGYIRPVSAGIHSLLPLGKRIVRKIEAIIREEMDAVEGQEVLMPVVLPAELWVESGRLESIGSELLRFKDRNDKNMLLAMTHEEAVCHLVRTEVNSYKQLPLMVYQIQTKYRDEARPRAGMIRAREFTMKDAYSFHADQECLDTYYDRVLQAYERIFQRVGLKNCVTIESDPGMMGGDTSHEFMALADCGEDVVFISPDGSYKANREVAVAKCEFKKEESLPLEKVATPGMKTIGEVAEFLNLKPENTGKAVFFQEASGDLIFAMIRGDLEVNEAKLRKIIASAELVHASDEAILASGAVPGYASPLSLDPAKIKIVVDRSVAECSNLVVGANESGCHYKNFNFDRDLSDAQVADIAMVREGDPCPLTGEPLKMRRGIEVGNIFKLGTKYSAPMNCSFLDQNGKSRNMIMGCYGIGVGRTMASVLEQSHDKWGPIWPISIAPYHVHLCSLNPKKEGVAAAADKIYADLLEKGVEVLYDDRGEKAGFMFNDADLTGIPYRLTVSPKTLSSSQIELKTRGAEGSSVIDLDAAATIVANTVFDTLKKKS
ncbi:MAG: proline--tRNA ligase [Kiritimatiellaeota bacterium]|nr:proline--tRNA ligase [Kiritimatiellota bacterium]